MTERVAERINEIVSEHSTSPVASEFTSRIKEGQFARDENPYTHFCVYFAGFDREGRKVFIGHHKKSGLWLFNGGHMDKGEIPKETLEREMGEEWGLKIGLESIGEPKLLTITPINNPTKQKCTSHYDIWFFVPLTEAGFKPDQKLLETEFHTTGWKSIGEARSLITDSNTLKAISEFERLFDIK
jgi:8-oxo-dGTP pyrophosphatase MutT (NUDIX family)